MRFIRLLKIIITLHRFGLYQILRDYRKTSFLAIVIETCLFMVPFKYKNLTLPVRVTLAFEELGPVFIKFGQLLSTRQDLIPPEYVMELSKLQNRVKPFPGYIAKQIVEKSLKRSIQDVFVSFSDEAVASASIAQVHYATIKLIDEYSNCEILQEVAVKVLRPGIDIIIAKDILLLKLVAWFIAKMFKDGKRLKPQAVIQEFEKTIHAELDFLQEAANATELSRLHKNDPKIIIPQVYFDYCSHDVIMLEWMNGTAISDLPTLIEKGIDLKELSHAGVAIFYTQVFHYGFFHADMHPGNILCDDNGKFISLDFGIVGCLSEEDKRYLAINILAFFNRDYKKVAITHVESGWAPPNTSIEELEGAIRAVCEPIFNKPLSQISFGQVLIKLFQVSRRFDIVVQPQLVLLQKTIVNVEGLGRMLNPDLDLWVTAKPILEKWMKEQMGLRGLLKNIKDELPYWSYILPKFPRNYFNSLSVVEELKVQNNNFSKLLTNYRNQNRLFIILILVIILVLFMKI